MDDGQAAVDAVRRYASDLRLIRGRLFADLPGLTLLGLMRAVVTGERPRMTRSPGGIEYFVHGIGCRMTDERGHVVDVDLIKRDDGITFEAFDDYRVKFYLDDEEGPSVAQLTAACSELAQRGELIEVQAERWYALPTDTHG
jgi:hypothetical protein